MRQIRYGVFESNSSSMHSIAIPYKVARDVKHAHFYFGEFGWDFEEVDPLDYLYTAIYEVYGDNAKEKIAELENILNKNGVECHFHESRCNAFFSHGYVDHGYELTSFLDLLFSDEDLMMRYINGARVFTGNDNSDSEERAFVNRDEPTYEEYDWKTKECTVHNNPYYMGGDEYQWFYK